MSDDDFEPDDETEVPQAAVDELRALWERDGKLTAETVLAAAADYSSALHDRFEWDDTIAAHEYRLEQARLVIRSVRIVVEERSVRAFPYVISAGSYAPLKDAFADRSWREEIVARFERDAAAFEARWKNHKVVAENYRKWKNQL